MQQVEWGEFKLDELFKPETSKKRFDANKVTVLESGKFPYVVRTSVNNGQRGYIDENEIYLNDGNTISFGQDTATMFYQEKPYFTGDKIKILRAKHDGFNRKNAQFFISAMEKTFSSFSWGSSSFNVEIIKKQKILLPTKNGKIDFEFMESFIAELEAQRITELEAYLLVTGLKDYTLTTDEQAALNKLSTTTWGKFKIEDVLVWQRNISELNPLHLDSLCISSEPKYPFYGQATFNNGIIEYRHLKEDVLNNKLGKSTILIHSNNQNIVYLDTPFYLKDGHGATSVLQSEYLDKITAQFFMASIKKVILQKYSYNAKATKIELKNTEINLPVKSDNASVDYSYMHLVISAIQKLVIKDVVLYADKKIAATKKVVNI